MSRTLLSHTCRFARSLPRVSLSSLSLVPWVVSDSSEPMRKTARDMSWLVGQARLGQSRSRSFDVTLPSSHAHNALPRKRPALNTLVPNTRRPATRKHPRARTRSCQRHNSMPHKDPNAAKHTTPTQMPYCQAHTTPAPDNLALSTRLPHCLSPFLRRELTPCARRGRTPSARCSSGRSGRCRRSSCHPSTSTLLDLCMSIALAV